MTYKVGPRLERVEALVDNTTGNTLGLYRLGDRDIYLAAMGDPTYDTHIHVGLLFLVNPFKSEFTTVIFIHYKPRIAVVILDL